MSIRNVNLCANINKEPKHCIGPSVILIASVFKTGKNYYPQVFLEECKYIIKEKKVIRYITDDLEISSGDSDEEYFSFYKHVIKKFKKYLLR